MVHASIGGQIGNDGGRYRMVEAEACAEDDGSAIDDDGVTADEVDFTQRIHETILRRKELPFAAILLEYRNIEEEFVARAGDDKEIALDFKRRISRKILSAAHYASEPQEVCRSLWEEVVERGFSDHEAQRMSTATYARCCQQNGEFAAGIAVLEPLIAEMARAIDSGTLASKDLQCYVEDIAMFHRIRDELKAGIRE